ncbi:MAG: hypothetical protein ACXADY_24055 [Candidatus Hodarchaeales archaeon]
MSISHLFVGLSNYEITDLKKTEKSINKLKNIYPKQGLHFNCIMMDLIDYDFVPILVLGKTRIDNNLDGKIFTWSHVYDSNDLLKYDFKKILEDREERGNTQELMSFRFPFAIATIQSEEIVRLEIYYWDTINSMGIDYEARSMIDLRSKEFSSNNLRWMPTFHEYSYFIRLKPTIYQENIKTVTVGNYQFEHWGFNLIFNCIRNKEYDDHSIVSLFNFVIISLNLLGIPISFVEIDDLRQCDFHPFWRKVLADEKKSKVLNPKKESLLTKIPKDYIGVDNLDEIYSHIEKLLTAITRLSENRKKDKDNVFKNPGPHEFLAIARYSFSHGEYQQAFIYSWISLEAFLTYIWKKKITEIYTAIEKSPAKILESDKWSTSVITEELFMLNILDKEQANRISNIRKHRNRIFHFLKSRETAPEKLKQIAENCIKSSLSLLFLILNVPDIPMEIDYGIKGISGIDFRNGTKIIFAE